MTTLNPIYTRQDILILQKCLNQYIAEQNRLSGEIELDIETLNMIVESYLSVEKPDPVWLTNKLKEATKYHNIGDKCHAMMYELPLEDMPLYINDGGGSAIAHWRLQIGR